MLLPTLALCSALRLGPAVAQEPLPTLVLTADTVLEPGELRARIVVAADGIVVEGRSTILVGPGRAGEPASFRGTGIFAEGREGIVLRDLAVRGFERGLHLLRCNGALLEGVDASDNHHDPGHGWGDGGHTGGMLLEEVEGARVLRCRAQRNWNGLELLRSRGCRIEESVFSHCSNVGLKLESASENVVRGCDISWGLRIRPGEVHARDSTGVLLESGSNDNVFEGNDVTHGGDGIFLRVLNGWVSTGNVFVGNDCSYANNNGFESWSPGNRFEGNRANHCSYGFWLGGSDHTVLVGNEASWNGLPEGFHNAPEPGFGHGGIVVVNGPGSHLSIEDNLCRGNAGGGIVLRGDLASGGERWRSWHVLVQGNRLEENRFGLYARHVDWLELCGNAYAGNDEDERLEDARRVLRRAPPEGPDPRPEALLAGPERVVAGGRARFDASASRDALGRALATRYEHVDARYELLAAGEGPSFELEFPRAGFHRVGLSVDAGGRADLAWRDVYVVDAREDALTEDGLARWSCAGAPGARLGAAEGLVGERALALSLPATSGPLSLRAAPTEPWDLTGATHLRLWLRARNASTHGFRAPAPVLRLHAGEAELSFTASRSGAPANRLLDVDYSEARAGWLRIELPLAGSADWVRHETVGGALPPHRDGDLEFTTLATRWRAGAASALLSTGEALWLALREGEQLASSPDGREWRAHTRPSTILGGAADWVGGALAFAPRLGEAGSLLLPRIEEQRGEAGAPLRRLARFDLARGDWEWLPARSSITGALALVDGLLYGIARSRLGDYGGALCRLDLGAPEAQEERSVATLDGGADPSWLGPAARLVAHEGALLGLKNDWSSPATGEGRSGDRVFRIDARDFAPSEHAGGDPDERGSWRTSTTPAQTVAILPFEVGAGAALALLPPGWCAEVGEAGGLFVLAGCSPADQDGRGAPSERFAIVDLASGAVRDGRLPGPTGAGGAAAFHGGRVYVKRGGTGQAAADAELWVVAPLPAERRGEPAPARPRFELDRVDALSIELDPGGAGALELAVDGLGFE